MCNNDDQLQAIVLGIDFLLEIKSLDLDHEQMCNRSKVRIDCYKLVNTITLPLLLTLSNKSEKSKSVLKKFICMVQMITQTNLILMIQFRNS